MVFAIFAMVLFSLLSSEIKKTFSVMLLCRVKSDNNLFLNAESTQKL